MIRQLRALSSKVKPTTLSDSSYRPSPRQKIAQKLANEPSFEVFILKGQVLQTYRTILRAVYKIPDVKLRAETKEFIKGEFKSSKDVEDIEIRRSLLIGGLRNWKHVSNVMGLSYTDIRF
ncbi:hypothetical protein DAMA08_047430 [Martiniozyma asiatica (nom. inval.)]|nr:hypothetical protein DAMA08_047430 [Martiniozyma asiatica]